MNPLLLEVLAHTAWKGAAVLGIALATGLLLRKTAAARRYAVWITSVATLAILPFAMSLLPAWRVLPKHVEPPDWQRLVVEPPLEESQPKTEAFQLPEASPASKPLPAIKPVPVPAKPWFTWSQVVDHLPHLWLSVSVLLLLRLTWSAMRLRKLEHSLPEGTCDEIASIAHEINLRRMPRLLIGAENAVPMVWGVFRPRLLLPSGFEQWSAEKRRGVLLHELAHLQRRDPLALWMAQWVKALHWFNPLAWLTIRQLRADQERACDDTALRHGIRASDYAQALLDLSRHCRAAPGLALCALTITRCAPVEARVKAILDPKRSRDPITVRWLASLCGLALLLLLPVAMLNAIEDPKLRGRILDRNGVVLAETTKEKSRHYPLKDLAAHVVGYTGKTKHDDPTPTGRFEVEKTQNGLLARGEDVRITLDIRVQALTRRAMVDAGFQRGAAVVLDPRTGEILAAVSLPSYDPNVFVPSISMDHWDALSANKDNPMLNRAVAEYVPGSTFMPLTGLAGIAAGKGDQKFYCEGCVNYGTLNFQCWINRQNGSKHGELGMAEALVQSCSCFWYQFGNAAGIDHIEGMGRKLGFGARYGIMDFEREGTLPGQAWMKEHRPNDKSTPAHVANTSIGQGMVLVTPLQMAVLAATVGNGGKVPQPVSVKQDGQTSLRADLIADGLPAAQIEQLREGMRLVVHGENGTGKAARSDKVMIAGKTGTAQNWRRVGDQRIEDNNTWFIGFAPFDKPTLAFAILKQGGKSGGTDCAPIAKRIVEEALALPADGSGEVEPLEEETKVEEISFSKLKAAFDREEPVIRRAFAAAADEANSGIQLTTFHLTNGRLTAEGIAPGMIQALAYREKMIEICRPWEIEWTFPVPETMEDGRRVRFQARGLSKAAAEEEKERAKRKEAMAKMNPLELRAYINNSSWQMVSRAGNLPDLPKSATLISASLDAGGFKERTGFCSGFTASREDALMWLRKALREDSSQLRDWPPAPLGFKESYQFFNGELVASSSDGKIVTICVQVQLRPPSIKPSNPLPIPKALEDQIIEKGKTVDAKVPIHPDDGNQTEAAPKPASKAEIRQQSDDAIRMRPADADKWKFLKSKGLLADLPAEAVVPVLSERDKQHSSGFFQFRFSAPRAAVRRWLLESLRVKEGHEEAFLNWPEKPGTFYRTYSAVNDCKIVVQSADGETVLVVVSKQKPRIMIAPEDSQPTAAPTVSPEVAWKEAHMPKLDLELSLLEPTVVSPKNEILPPLYPNPGPKLIKIRAPLPKGLSLPMIELRQITEGPVEDADALRLRMKSSNRFQQSLLVKEP